MIRIKKCKHCKKEFKTQDNRRKYCGYDCAYEGYGKFYGRDRTGRSTGRKINRRDFLRFNETLYSPLNADFAR